MPDLAPEGPARALLEGPEGSPAPLPDAVRDVLPVECAELRGVETALRDAFAAFGYREVATPLLEFAAVMDRAQEGGLGRAFRLFDDHGRVLVLRPDLTIPVARLLATRMADHPGPVRVSYVAPALRPPRPGRAEDAEQRQAGVELVGLEGPEADAEVIGLLAAALSATGLAGARIGVGDVGLVAAVVRSCGVDEDGAAALRAALAGRSMVAWRRAVGRLGLTADAAGLLGGLPATRGGPEVLERIAAAAPDAAPACARLARTLELAEAHGAGEVLLDLGVLRDWPYYSGVVLEAYAPGVGAPVAVGGRYDGLAARFGRPRPAVGVAVMLDLLHRALAPRGGEAPPRQGVVLVGGCDEDLASARALRAAGVPVVAVPAGGPDPEALAAADGWRYVARREGAGHRVLDRVSGDARTVDRIEEALRSAP